MNLSESTVLSSSPGGMTKGLPRILQTALIAALLALSGALSPISSSLALAEESGAVTESRTVNVNTADAQTLADVLQGVGPSRAEEIIRYREAFGPFKSVDELIDVKGIGPATLDKNRAFITLE